MFTSRLSKLFCRNHRVRIILLTIFFTGCTGVKVPYTNFHLARSLIETKSNRVNINCIESENLNIIKKYLENRHVIYLQSEKIEDALTKEEIVDLLKDCKDNLIYLSIEEIKKELFSDSQPSNPEALKLFGGFYFTYNNTITESGLQPTLHLIENFQGERHKLLVIYRLKDNKVIHYNNSGADKIFEQKRSWPLTEVLEFIVEGIGKAIL